MIFFLAPQSVQFDCENNYFSIFHNISAHCRLVRIAGLNFNLSYFLFFGKLYISVQNFTLGQNISDVMENNPVYHHNDYAQVKIILITSVFFLSTFIKMPHSNERFPRLQKFFW